ncbi:MAG: hypothetical protein J3R72DRAFT_421032 [Linnemannia gamsii]|nr:MAG: hypothetical protein J3R72DRAFT_421032 [Linnemannia gamsii]
MRSSSCISKAALMLVLAVLITDLAASGPSSVQAVPIKTRKRSLSSPLYPILAALQPTTTGVVNGVVQTLGCAANQLPNGHGSVGGNVVAGIDQTIWTVGQTVLKSISSMNCLRICQDVERVCDKKCSDNDENCLDDCEDAGELCATSCLAVSALLAVLSNP